MIINGSALLKLAPIKNMLSTKERTDLGLSHGLCETGYDIRIRQDVWFFSSPGKQSWAVFDKGILQADGAGRFCLASSIEEFQMPDCLMGQVLNKSSWARRGLDASMATNLEPKWNGFLTLELVYHGQEELHIPAGSGIAQVIFHEIAVPANYQGSYQNQDDRPVPSIVK